MSVIKQGLSNSTEVFNLNGLDYNKDKWEIFYSGILYNELGLIIENSVRVGIRNINDKSYVIQPPIKFTDYKNSSNINYTDLNIFLSDISNIIGFIDPITGGSGSTDTPSQIKTKYESNPDTNAYTDLEKSKLSSVDSGAEENPTGSEIVESINSELGQVNWQSGGSGQTNPGIFVPTSPTDFTSPSSLNQDKIWWIEQDFDLGGVTTTLPSGITLVDRGGSIFNGTVVLVNSVIDNSLLRFDLSFDSSSTGNLTNSTYVFDKYKFPQDETIANPTWDNATTIAAATTNINHINKAINDCKLFGAKEMFIDDLDVYIANAPTGGVDLASYNLVETCGFSIQLPSDFHLIMSENTVIRSHPSNTYSQNIISVLEQRNVKITGGKLLGSRDTHNYQQARPITVASSTTPIELVIGVNADLITYSIPVTVNDADAQSLEITTFINNDTGLQSLGYNASSNGNTFFVSNTLDGLYFRVYEDTTNSDFRTLQSAYDITFELGIAIVGSENVTVDGVTMNDCYGDGLVAAGNALASAPNYINSRNITVQNCFFSANRRNNISPIGVEQMLITRCQIHRAGVDNVVNLGSAPRLGIDCEPTRGRDSVTGEVDDNNVVRGIVISNNYCLDNEFGAINLYSSYDSHAINNVTNGRISAQLTTKGSIRDNTINFTLGDNSRSIIGNQRGIDVTAFVDTYTSVVEISKSITITGNKIIGGADNAPGEEIGIFAQGWNQIITDNIFENINGDAIVLNQLRDSQVDTNIIKDLTTNPNSVGLHIVSTALKNVFFKGNIINVNSFPIDINNINSDASATAINMVGTPSIYITDNILESKTGLESKIRASSRIKFRNNEVRNKLVLSNINSEILIKDNELLQGVELGGTSASNTEVEITRNKISSDGVNPAIEFDVRGSSSDVTINNNTITQPSGLRAIYVSENGGEVSNFKIFDNRLIGSPSLFIEFEGDNSYLLNNTTLDNLDLNLVTGSNNSNITYAPYVFIPTAFRSTWVTTTPSEVVTLPLSALGTHDITIDWGDGNTETFNASGTTLPHTYNVIGTYEISIVGDFKGLNFNNSGDLTKIKNIVSWGNSKLLSLNYYGCTDLTISATDAPDISSMTSLVNAFRNCDSINTPDFSSWNVGSIVNFSSMFRDALSANPNIASWNMSNGTDVQGMFLNNDGFNQDLSGWDISNITNLALFNLNGDGWSTANYDATLIGWATQTVNSGLTFDAGNVNYSSSAQASRDILTGTYGWTINDNGL